MLLLTLTVLTACTTNKLPPPEPVIVEKTVNIYVTIPGSLLVDKCAEPAVLSYGDTILDLVVAVNKNRTGIEKCQNVIDAIINYNNEAMKKSAVQIPRNNAPSIRL